MDCRETNHRASAPDASEHMRLKGFASLLTSKPLSKSFIVLGRNAKESACGPEPGKAAANYMWKWGDRNRIATLNPARWSKYQCVASMLREFQVLTPSNLSRPVKIKDRGSGTWKFNTVAEAMGALTAALDNGEHALNELTAAVENRGHLLSQSTVAEPETSSPEADVDKKRSRSAMWPSARTCLTETSSPQEMERSASSMLPSPGTSLAERSSPQSDVDVERFTFEMLPSAGTSPPQADVDMERSTFEMLPSVGTWLAARPYTHHLQKAASCEIVDGDAKSEEIKLQKHNAGVAPEFHRVVRNRNLRSGDLLKRLSWCAVCT